MIPLPLLLRRRSLALRLPLSDFPNAVLPEHELINLPPGAARVDHGHLAPRESLQLVPFVVVSVLLLAAAAIHGSRWFFRRRIGAGGGGGGSDEDFRVGLFPWVLLGG